MRRVWGILGIGLVLAGCTPVVQERVRDYNQDGIHLYAQGDYLAARESFEAALALQPEDAGLLYNVGECYDHMGNMARAEHYYGECLLRAPNHAECRHA